MQNVSKRWMMTTGMMVLATLALAGCSDGGDNQHIITYKMASVSTSTSDRATIQFDDLHPVVDPDGNGVIPNIPPKFQVSIKAPASASVSVLTANGRPVGTLTATDANGAVVFTVPLSSGTRSVQTLNSGAEIVTSVAVTPDQFPKTGVYQMTASVQTQTTSSPVTLGPLTITVQ